MHRPDVMSDQSQFGHWECDLMMFRKEFGRANVTSLVERVSRFAVVLKNPDRQSKPVMEGLITGLAALPRTPAGRSPSTAAPRSSLGATSGGAAWIRGFAIRSHLGRKARLKTRTAVFVVICRVAPIPRRSRIDIRSICDRLNTTPRKCPGSGGSHSG